MHLKQLRSFSVSCSTENMLLLALRIVAMSSLNATIVDTPDTHENTFRFRPVQLGFGSGDRSNRCGIARSLQRVHGNRRRIKPAAFPCGAARAAMITDEHPPVLWIDGNPVGVRQTRVI